MEISFVLGRDNVSVLLALTLWLKYSPVGFPMVDARTSLQHGVFEVSGLMNTSRDNFHMPSRTVCDYGYIYERPNSPRACWMFRIAHLIKHTIQISKDSYIFNMQMNNNVLIAVLALLTPVLGAPAPKDSTFESRSFYRPLKAHAVY